MTDVNSIGANPGSSFTRPPLPQENTAAERPSGGDNDPASAPTQVTVSIEAIERLASDRAQSSDTAGALEVGQGEQVEQREGATPGALQVGQTQETDQPRATSAGALQVGQNSQAAPEQDRPGALQAGQTDQAEQQRGESPGALQVGQNANPLQQRIDALLGSESAPETSATIETSGESTARLANQQSNSGEQNSVNEQRSQQPQPTATDPARDQISTDITA